VKEKTVAPDENRRLGEALYGTAPQPPEPAAEQRIEIDAALSWTDREKLAKADFDTMTATEWEQAKRLLTRIDTLFAQRPTRRHLRASSGERIDLAAMLRDSARHGGEFARLAFRRRRTRPIIACSPSCSARG